MAEIQRLETNTEQYTSEILPESASAALSALDANDLMVIDPEGLTPLTSEYTHVLANMEIQMHHAFDQLKPEEAKLVTAVINHNTAKQRCEVAQISRKKYDSLMQLPKVKKAIGLIAAYSITQSGGTRASRKLMLSDIANRNAHSRPHVAISATAELNRMEETEQAFVFAKEQADQAQQSGGVLFEFKLT